MPNVKPDSDDTSGLLERVRAGDRQALDSLLQRHRSALRAFIDFHLDPRLRKRFDPSDVVQETQLDVLRQIDGFLERRPMPFHIWVRKTAYQRLIRLRRDHVTTGRRSVEREAAWPDRSSLVLARL